MKRSDYSIPIALCCSIAAHAAGLFAIRRLTVGSQGFVTHVSGDASRWVRPEKPTDRLLVAPPQPRSPQFLPDPKLPDAIEDEQLFGERGSKGKGMNATTGDVPLQARQAPEFQAALTTNPGPLDQGSHGESGHPGATGSPELTASVGHESSTPMMQLPFGPPVDPNTPFGSPPIPSAPPLPPPAFQKESSTAAAIPVPSPDPFPVKSSVANNDSPATQPSKVASSTAGIDEKAQPSTDTSATQPSTRADHQIAKISDRPMNDPVGQRPSTTQPSLIQLMAARPQAPTDLLALSQSSKTAAPQTSMPMDGSPGSAGGDPGNKSESESDPFSDTPTITYRNGKVEARDGRRVKTVRPKLTEAGWVALSSMEDPMVTFGVSIDERGKVTNVEYLHRSGSNEVDHPAYLAMWKWEFEPSKDKNGHVKPDLLIIPLIWR